MYIYIYTYVYIYIYISMHTLNVAMHSLPRGFVMCLVPVPWSSSVPSLCPRWRLVSSQAMAGHQQPAVADPWSVHPPWGHQTTTAKTRI